MRESRIGSMKSGAISCIIAIVFYIVVPVVLIHEILPMVPEGSIDLEGIKALLTRWMYAGVPMIILAFPARYYQKGNRNRLTWDSIRIVFSCIWLLYVLNFGNLDGILSFKDAESTVIVNIAMLGLVLVLIVFKLLKIMVAYGDHKDHRPEFLEENDVSDTNGSPPGNDGIRVKGRYD